MILILLGLPGSGKGTQAKLLSSDLKIPQISPGDILRDNLKRENRKERKVRDFMQRGELVPDDIILQLMERRTQESDCQRGFILDGFPRTRIQAQGLDKSLKKMDKKVDWVIKLDISGEKAQKRLTNRIACTNCGEDFNLETNPPQISGICDNCGAMLERRFDDKREIIQNRLKVYEQETKPVQDYYRKQNKLLRINGELSPEMVFQEIQRAIEANSPNG